VDSGLEEQAETKGSKIVIATHSTTITGKCPHGCEDIYKATFRAVRLIPVEVIEAAIKALTHTPIYQESLTRALADVLVCEVTMIGDHGSFTTTTTAGAP